ncbi:uncharacterized protein [Pempheris klunzingeri]|uniref:uncharacterized protein isoform X2 n=1 Tax=Pempheris klunzingeri TaxID=3127111 RepID=UPI003980C896
MQPRCSCCAAPIPPQAKGYKRKSLLSLLDRRSARTLFPDLDPRDAFLCFGCVRDVYQRTKKCGKRRTYVDPNPPHRPAAPARPGLPLPGDPPPPKKLKKRLRCPLDEHDYASQDPAPSSRPDPPAARRLRRGPISQVCAHLRRKNYSSALNRLLQLSGFREALVRVCGRVISTERKQMLSDEDGPYRTPFGPDALAAFGWDRATSWAEEKAPLTAACLRSMFPPAKKIQRQIVNYRPGKKPRQMTDAEAKQTLDRRIGVLLAVALYSSSPRASFLQTAFGVEMLRHRCPLRLFAVANSLGLSQSKTTARIHARKLADDHDRQVKQWRDEIQSSRRTQHCSDDSRKAAPFSFTWGRVQVPSASAERGNTAATWAFRFAHRGRVNFRYLHGPPIKAVQVSPCSILPTKQTYESMRQRMKTIVMRIIADNLTALKGPRGRVLRHVPHVYAHLMREESATVSLGAVIPNPSETSLSAALGLKDFIPVVSGAPYHVLCCGDAVGADRTDKSQNDEQPNPETGNRKFDGLIEAPQEFRKELVFHEEMLKMLLSEKSENARGTLRHIISLFHFKTFNSSAKDYFLNIWDFIRFVTTAYVTLFAVTDCGLDSVDQRPADYPPQASAQADWLSAVAHRLVDLVWMPPSQEDINAAAAAGLCDGDDKVSPLCYCREEKPGERLVRCCSNLCAGIWFHEGCAQARTLADPQEDWFCSTDCSADGTYVYCHCKEQRGGQMVQCGLMDKCRRHEWYHRECLTAAERTAAEQTPWFCSESCSTAADGEDFLFNYTRAVVWEGLYHMTRRDAIQEGDGDAMTDFWKMDLVLLWTRQHLQLFRSGHQMITGVIEFGKGSFTKQQVEQSAHLAGDQAKHLDRLFFTGGSRPNLSSHLSRLTAPAGGRTEDVSHFVEEFRKDELFSFRPGRKHRGFEGFSYQQRVKNPQRLGRTIRSLCEQLDRHRDQVL